jgi:hypothetical protein
VVAYLTFVNNFGIPKLWDIFLSGAPLGATLWKHLTLIAYMPVPVAIFSWLPKLSEQFYGGKHFIQGPGLWLLTLALIMVFVFLGKTVRRLSLLRYQ